MSPTTKTSHRQLRSAPDRIRGWLRIASLLIPALLAIVAALAAAIPAISISDSVFKPIVLASIGSLSVFVLTSDAWQLHATHEVGVLLYNDPVTLYSAAASDVHSHLGTARTIRLCSTSPIESLGTTPARDGFRQALLEAAALRPPNDCDIRILYALSRKQDVETLLLRLERFSNAFAFSARCYVHLGTPCQFLDPLVIGTDIAYVAHSNRRTGQNERGMRLTDARSVGYLVEYFDEVWNSAPYAVCTHPDGISHSELSRMAMDLGEK